MSQKDPIDQLFREKLAARQFEFDAGAWAAAEALIVADEKGPLWYKRGLFWWSISGIAAAVLLGWVALGTSENASEQIAEKSDAPIELVKDNADLPSPKESTEVNALETSSSEALKDLPTPEVKGGKSVRKVIQVASPLTLEESGPNEKSVKTQKDKTEDINVKVAQKIPADEEKLDEQESNGNPTVPSQDENKIGLMDNASPIPADKGEIFGEEAGPLDLASLPTIPETARTENLALMATNEAYLDWIPDNKSLLIPSNLPDQSKLIPKTHKLNIDLIGGFNFALGYKNVKGSRNGYPSPGMVVGSLFNFQFANNMGINSGVILSSRGQLNGAVTFINTSISESTTRTPLNLVYLDIPIYFNYRLSNVSSVAAGFQFSSLATTTTRIQNQKIVNGENQRYESIVWGEKDGFDNDDFSILVGYDHSVYPGISLGGRFHFSNFDITDDDYFRNEHIDRNIQFRVFGRVNLASLF